MKKALIFSGITLVSLLAAALCFVRKEATFAGDISQTGRICADITFGTTADTSTSEATSFTSLYTALNLNISEVEGSKIFLAKSGNAPKFGSSSGGGSLSFTFGSGYRISKVKALAWKYGSDAATITVTTSAFSGSTAQSVTATSAPDISDSSTDEGYVFSGLDGGNGSVSTGLTITSNKRFYLAKLVLTITGASEVASSSASAASSSSIASSSVMASSSSSTASYLTNSAWPSQAFNYRIAPGDYSTATSAPVYDVSSANGAYLGNQVSTIEKTQDCLTYEEVCLYYAAFRQVPPNYKTSNSEAIAYGVNGRLLSEYSKVTYTGSNDYSETFGTFYNTNPGDYWELDIDITGSYNNGSKLTRGAARVVIVPQGLADYGNVPVSFYTKDHYADFVEFYNFRGGWSPLFAGVENGSGSYHNVPTTSATRISPSTVSFSLS